MTRSLARPSPQLRIQDFLSLENKLLDKLRFMQLNGNNHNSHPPPPPPPPHPPGVTWGWGRVEPFFRTFIQKGLRSNWVFGWELALKVGVIFFRWDSKTTYMKNSEYKSQAKKIDPNCNFYNFSFLFPYANKFVVVRICIVIFHGIYSPLSTNIFFVGG